MTKLRFMYNGVKVGKGKLHKAWYCYQKPQEACKWMPEGVPERITIYGDGYGFRGCFPTEFYEEFTVRNATDTQTDYFEKDRTQVTRTHPLWAEVAAAWKNQQAKRMAHAEKAYQKKGHDCTGLYLTNYQELAAMKAGDQEAADQKEAA